MRTKGRCWSVLGVCLLVGTMLSTTGCMPLQILHGTAVAVNPIGEPQMAYTSPVKKLLVTETIVQTIEGPVILTQAVSDAFARTGVEVIKPVQFTIGTQVSGQSAATALPADHVLTVTLDKPVSPLGPSQLILGFPIVSA